MARPSTSVHGTPSQLETCDAARCLPSTKMTFCVLRRSSDGRQNPPRVFAVSYLVVGGGGDMSVLVSSWSKHTVGGACVQEQEPEV